MGIDTGTALLRRTGLLSLALALWWTAGVAVGVSYAKSHELNGGSTAGHVDTARVLDASTTGSNWLVNGENFGSWHFSPLTQIDSKNIRHLGLAWSLDLDSPAGLATEPIEVDGTLYVSGAPDRVFAIDAATGRIRWRYTPKIDFSHSLTSSYTSRVNRGVAVWEGRVFIGSGDCRMTALDASTGKVLWQTLVCDPVQTGITGSPAVGGGRVFIGYHGSDTGTRGSVVALDARTGKIDWRFWNVPGDPFEGYRNKALAMAAKTWSGEDWWRAGGGVVWDSIVYDPATGLVIYGTAGPGVGRNPPVQTSGDRLFTDCVVALRADTGQYVWHNQTSKLAPPGTESPENFHIVIANLTVDGVKRHVAMTVPRWGGFVVLDAKKGSLISSKLMSSASAGGGGSRGAGPLLGRDWFPMSYSPLTGLVYVPLYQRPSKPGEFDLPGAKGELVAWSPLRQVPVWSIEQQLPINAGVLSTAGNLVFQGEGTGVFSAYSADKGRKLWSFATGSAIDGTPISYASSGRQYILVPVGLGSGTRFFGADSRMATPQSKRGPSRLLAFALGAKTPFRFPSDVVPPVPEPPVQTASAEEIAHGKRLVMKFDCWICHGGPTLDGQGAWVTHGSVPDLRYMPQQIHREFYAIVLGGVDRSNGMPGFADGELNWPAVDQMTADEAKAIHAYIVDLQWKAYRADQKRLDTGAKPGLRGEK